jgi:malate/lactate dehydrogenase
MKVGIVGIGRVGAACELSLVARGSAREEERRSLDRSAEVLRQAAQRIM